MRGQQLAYGRYDRILVVGAGPAGLSAAETLRRRGFEGQIVVLGKEPHMPYDRPGGSKGILTGHQKPSDLTLKLAEGTEIDWHIGRGAVDLDPYRHEVAVDTGEVYQYDGLVIATGSDSVFPKGFPVGQPGIHGLHSIEDAWAIRQDLRKARRVAIVGGGLTGCETACAVVNQAREAVIIDSKTYVMGRAVGEQIGTLITKEHKASGIEMRQGRVNEVDRRNGRWRLTLSTGKHVSADMVVVTAGEKPDTDWLATSGLDISDGVLCDEILRVVGQDDIVAAGVLARWPNLRYGPEPMRCGQWIAALEHGRAAAHALLAVDHEEVPPVTILPRFWSQQHGLRINVAGQLDDTAEVTLTELRPGREDVASAGVMASYYQNGRLAGLVAVNAPHAFTSTTRTLINSLPDIQRTSNVTSIRRLSNAS